MLIPSSDKRYRGAMNTPRALRPRGFLAAAIIFSFATGCGRSTPTSDDSTSVANDTVEADGSESYDTDGTGPDSGFPAVSQNIGAAPTFEEPAPAGVMDVSATLDLDGAGHEYLGFGLTMQFDLGFCWALHGARSHESIDLLDDLFAPDKLNGRYIVVGPISSAEYVDPDPPLVYKGGYYTGAGDFVLDDPPTVTVVEYVKRYGTHTIVRPQTAPAPMRHVVDGKTKLKPSEFHAFADYLVDYVKALEELTSSTVMGVVPQNEPDFVAAIESQGPKIPHFGQQRERGVFVVWQVGDLVLKEKRLGQLEVVAEGVARGGRGQGTDQRPQRGQSGRHRHAARQPAGGRGPGCRVVEFRVAMRRRVLG